MTPLPKYRINDQVIFTTYSGTYYVGIIYAIEGEISEEGDWVYSIKLIDTTARIEESRINGVVFEAKDCYTKEEMCALTKDIELP